MSQALYRKYRSKKLTEIVGQDHITATLSNALKKGAISHAYLFTGPRGVGKTSIARILAHEVNKLSYDEKSTHLDIIEIDAASNRRIDEIRDLRERVHTAPVIGPYKVYIIDEVHMLTKEAFNALLKTLEEPPAHVIFILATTEPHKLPETIISRTQRYNFRPIEKDAAVNHLAHLAEQENIKIEPAALKLLAEHGEGSFRDSISLLDQVSSLGQTITAAHVQTMLGVASTEAIDELVNAMQSGDRRKLISLLSSLRDQGYLAARIAKQLSAKLRQLLINNKVPDSISDIYKLLRELIEIPASHDPESLLEITLLTALAPPISPVITAEIYQEPVIPEADIVAEISMKKPIDRPKAKELSQTDAHKPVETKDDDSWQLALKSLKKRHNTLYSIARMARPHFDGDTLILELGFPFHQKRLNEDKNKQVLSEILKEILSRNITIICKLNPEHKTKAKTAGPAKKPADSSLDTISNIFGGGEMLES